MFYYVQSTGEFGLQQFGRRVEVIGYGYAGAPPHVNDPSSDRLIRKGPLPRGEYEVIERRFHPRFAQPLFALTGHGKASEKETGRSAFLIHGDNHLGNRSASSGCIVLRKKERGRVQRLVRQGYDWLIVYPDDGEAPPRH